MHLDAVERMKDQALVGGVLERRRRFVERRKALGGLPSSREVVLGMGERVQLRRAACEGKRNSKQQSEKNALAHARIIHALPTGPRRR